MRARLRSRPTTRSPSRQGRAPAPSVADGTNHVVGNRALAAAVQRRAPLPGNASPSVQRAILAIDGASDNATAQAATRNCLVNLTAHKQVRIGGGKQTQTYPAGDARGRVFGPAVTSTAVGLLKTAAPTLAPDETLYILGHGSAGAGGKIADLTAANMAGVLLSAFRAHPTRFTGAIKFVACYSASMVEDGERVPDTQTYAEAVAATVEGAASPTFRPRAFEGTRGIAWVDEDTGRRVGYDVNDEALEMNPLEEVYAAPAFEQLWFAALTHPDPAKRKRRMARLLRNVHQQLNKTTVPIRVEGKPSRRRYTPDYFRRMLSDLDTALKGRSPDMERATELHDRLEREWNSLSGDRRDDFFVAYLKAISDYTSKSAQVETDRLLARLGA